jgi:hypothetical protein
MIPACGLACNDYNCDAWQKSQLVTPERDLPLASTRMRSQLAAALKSHNSTRSINSVIRPLEKTLFDTNLLIRPITLSFQPLTLPLSYAVQAMPKRCPGDAQAVLK